MIMQTIFDKRKVMNAFELSEIALKDNRDFMRGFIRIRFGQEIDYVVDFIGTVEEYKLTADDNITAIPITSQFESTREQRLGALITMIKIKVKERGT